MADSEEAATELSLHAKNEGVNQAKHATSKQPIEKRQAIALKTLKQKPQKTKQTEETKTITKETNKKTGKNRVRIRRRKDRRNKRRRKKERT